MSAIRFSRRDLLWVPMIARAQDRPRVTHGIQVGDVTSGRATVWARSDRDAEMTVVAGGKTFRGLAPATGSSGFTARTELSGLPADESLEFTVRFGSGDPIPGRLRTAPLRCGANSSRHSGC